MFDGAGKAGKVDVGNNGCKLGILSQAEVESSGTRPRSKHIQTISSNLPAFPPVVSTTPLPDPLCDQPEIIAVQLSPNGSDPYDAAELS